MTMHQDLIARLRNKSGAWINGLYDDEAATALEQQAAEIARLRDELEACCTLKREYQGREVAAIAERDALRVDAERWRYFVAHCEWLRHDKVGAKYSSMSIRLPYWTDQSCVAMRNAAIDTARAAREST